MVFDKEDDAISSTFTPLQVQEGLALSDSKTAETDNLQVHFQP
jgi:hypothetical protein